MDGRGGDLICVSQLPVHAHGYLFFNQPAALLEVSVGLFSVSWVPRPEDTASGGILRDESRRTERLHKPCTNCKLVERTCFIAS